MSAPVGRREFFALEAGEYLERLSLLAAGTGAPSGEDLVRYARALRGAALMAGPPGYAIAAAAIENAAKAVREGSLAWTPALAERLADALEQCKGLLRRVRDWSEPDLRRCELLAQQLDGLVGSVGRRSVGGTAAGATGLSPGVRAYVAREAAAVAATLEQVAEAVERRPGPESAKPVLQRLQPLRGLGALPGLSPLPEFLEALDLTLAVEGRGGAWPRAAGYAFRTAAGALSRMARDIAELGIPQHDSYEIGQAVDVLRDAFARIDDVVPIEALFVQGDRDPVVSRGTPPVTPTVSSGVAIELAGLSDRLRQTAEQLRGGGSRSARALQLHTLALTLRGLILSREVREATGNFLSRIDREIMTGRAVQSADEILGLLLRAVEIIGAASRAEVVAGLRTELAPLCGDLDRIGRVDAPEGPPVVPIEQLAPESDAGVVPIETLFFDPVASAAPGYSPFEQTFATYFRLTHPERAAPPTVVPIESLAPEPEAVPIQALLYRGRRALERADLVRRELDAALRARRNVTGVEPLLAELLDLVPLALDDDH